MSGLTDLQQYREHLATKSDASDLPRYTLGYRISQAEMVYSRQDKDAMVAQAKENMVRRILEHFSKKLVFTEEYDADRQELNIRTAFVFLDDMEFRQQIIDAIQFGRLLEMAERVERGEDL